MNSNIKNFLINGYHMTNEHQVQLECTSVSNQLSAFKDESSSGDIPSLITRPVDSEPRSTRQQMQQKYSRTYRLKKKNEKKEIKKRLASGKKRQHKLKQMCASLEDSIELIWAEILKKTHIVDPKFFVEELKRSKLEYSTKVVIHLLDKKDCI